MADDDAVRKIEAQVQREREEERKRIETETRAKVEAEVLARFENERKEREAAAAKKATEERLAALEAQNKELEARLLAHSSTKQGRVDVQNPPSPFNGTPNDFVRKLNMDEVERLSREKMGFPDPKKLARGPDE